MAPMFYCRCSNCSCKATVLITQKIENRKDEFEDQIRESDDSNITINWEDLIKDDENRKEDGQNTTEQIEESSRVLESVFLLVCLIIIILGKNSGGQVRLSRATLKQKFFFRSFWIQSNHSEFLFHKIKFAH